jgi:hypothetical protein
MKKDCSIEQSFSIFVKNISMYKTLAKINKIILPSFTKQNLDLAKAKKWQLAIIGYRALITMKSLEK